ncbi:MAG: 2-amino-4-hydroxy-6-hydroxymethyldihydropteridine diphosphokinase [Synechococcales bacterium]|nr:2-amino-4-hydroxy-6-hydroxymethyldihydropteridine diphosphokinase [Synechococcales bacterium]
MTLETYSDLNCHRAAIALGSNLGDSASILTAALQALDQLPHTAVVARSHYYRTVAVGPPQPDYLNACAVVTTHLSPAALMQHLLGVEAHFGRVRRERWGPRLLDLDLILFDDLILNQPTLQVPHPRMHQRAFVLVPLAEVAADWIDPMTGRAIADLLLSVDQSGIARHQETHFHRPPNTPSTKP